jgi:hypothetical protein
MKNLREEKDFINLVNKNLILIIIMIKYFHIKHIINK